MNNDFSVFRVYNCPWDGIGRLGVDSGVLGSGFRAQRM